jgi:hypothetical protein
MAYVSKRERKFKIEKPKEADEPKAKKPPKPQPKREKK